LASPLKAYTPHTQPFTKTRDIPITTLLMSVLHFYCHCQPRCHSTSRTLAEGLLDFPVPQCHRSHLSALLDHMPVTAHWLPASDGIKPQLLSPRTPHPAQPSWLALTFRLLYEPRVSWSSPDSCCTQSLCAQSPVRLPWWGSTSENAPPQSLLLLIGRSPAPLLQGGHLLCLSVHPLQP
jgi:hypothetical protein